MFVSGRLPLFGGGHLVQRIGAVALAVELEEVFDAFFRDVVADHAVALAIKLLHVDEGGVVRRRAARDDTGLEKRLDQHAEDVGGFLHAFADMDVRQGFHERALHPFPVEADRGVDVLLLFRRAEVEEQDLEDFPGPVLDRVAFFRLQVRNGAVRPDLSEFVMEGFVRHGELHQLHHQRVAAPFVEGSEGAHGETFDKHLHADELLPDERRVDEFGQHIAERRADGHGLAPAGLDVVGEAGHVTGFLARLVGGVFLRARILQDVAEARGQGQRACFAVKDGGETPLHVEIDELDLLLLVELVLDGGLQVGVLLGVDQVLVFHVEGDGEVDVLLVHRVPEMIVGRRDDLVEGGGTVAVAVNFHHRRKIVGSDGLVSRVHRDIGRDLGHYSSYPCPAARNLPLVSPPLNPRISI
ncbi:conserved hypothetical protein [Parvibaculum lavamentivorans DS-1]|uniref:NAD-specific glutamate dehydrogenase n=1 Tax=Parvibaculum lavamentivorans (strain DS-1 / DSM 13023 / NCIMB 13966) TaxID=402881 RepID=A7HV91_PARL1|nr:conserved hypothetical protein [Parvibaculum lavamentivorans DS-1]